MSFDEPKALAADLLSEIVSYVKASRPTRTDGSSTQGFVYCQMRPGQMISPRDFSRPWSPMGGSGAASAPPPGATPPAGAAPADSSSTVARRARSAAFNTAQLCDTMYVVTDDTTTVTYSGGGRRLDVVYPQLLSAMECAPLPPRPPEVEARLTEARAVLMDADGNDSKLYARYLANADKYGEAIAAFTVAQNRMLADPAQADSAPMLLAPYQAKVDRAYDKWKSDDAEKVEAALAVTQSMGVPLEQGMIANARKLLTAWSLPISGVPGVNTPYTYLLPSEWSSIEVDDIGWTTLTRDSSEYHTHYERHGYGLNTGEWSGGSSSTNVNAGLSVFGFGFHGGSSSSDGHSSSGYSQTGSDGSTLNSDATELSISLQYGLMRMTRPWLVTDLFRMRNWYLRGEKAGVISDGTIANQVGKEQPYLPMLPTHFIVIRNVKITARNWGSVKDTLTSYWGRQQRSDSYDASSYSGGVSIPVFGPFALNGGVSRSDSHYRGDFKDESGNDCRDDFGAFFDGETLTINGAQVCAVLAEVLQACPPQSDPTLPADENATAGAGVAGQQ